MNTNTGGHGLYNNTLFINFKTVITMVLEVSNFNGRSEVLFKGRDVICLLTNFYETK